MSQNIRIAFLQIDAFTDQAFRGNPAAVCPLDAWLPDAVLQAIARENNLSETAFFVPAGDADEADFHLRWFTPEVEVDLCGHATLAAGHAILSNLHGKAKAVRFGSQAGILTVTRDGDRLSLDLPARRAGDVAVPSGLYQAMGAAPLALWGGGRDYLLLYESQADIARLRPDFVALKALGRHGFIATAPGDDCDFVSRCFFPGYGVDEDPVTGSAHCVSAPFWADRLGKNTLFARQISARGGDLWIHVTKDRVHMSGHCVEVIAGEMSVPESV
ncbi:MULTISPECIES: PhzF family phenazine biosynthesis protein [unclassified Iodidimonas]|jgi:PhzF family phenazine biosynthesis protein|uniref:PhzF family phenazine biosynthesis protein n=1 Tax=unclassified Iodidimonas TaxID=2626145 RepID=UPI0024822608|nr:MULTISPECIES: PhzF family phenazine biosynthesis protein [unclassified Iodidimonas]